MDYLDATEPLNGLLRARFKTASSEQTQRLAELFAPVSHVLFKQAIKERKARIGFSGLEATSKSFFAREILKAIIKPILERKFLSDKVSQHFLDFNENWYSIYDAKAVESAKIRAERSEEVAIECASHADHIMTAIGHFVEWPEDDVDTEFNAIWYLDSDEDNFLYRLENSNRFLKLYATDEIAAMQEFEQFLADAESEGLLLSRE